MALQRPRTEHIDATWNKVSFEPVDEHGIAWRIFYRRKWKSTWLEVKVVADKPAEHKANYALSWNGQELMGPGKNLLYQYRPGIANWVVRKLPQPKDVLPTVGSPRLYEARLKGDLETVCEMGNIDGVDWIFARKTDDNPNSSWRNYAVYALGEAPHKAIYYVAWNGERASKNKDMAIMEQYRPELYNAVIEKLKELN